MVRAVQRESSNGNWALESPTDVRMIELLNTKSGPIAKACASQVNTKEKHANDCSSIRTNLSLHESS